MRAVIYARFSSENQQEASIEDQVRGAMALIEARGWTHFQTYSDRAMSGATTLRPSYQALLADAESNAFDVVVSEGLDRLSRDQEATAALYKRLSFHGIQLVTRAEGEVNELHVGLKSTMNQLFLKDLAMKTHRGLEGRIAAGRSAGGKAYGYRSVKSDSDDDRGKLTIEPSEADVIRQIFKAFAAGHSPRAIARELNESGVPGPSGREWRDTTLRGHATRQTGILRNRLYQGERVWNKQRYDRNPQTGKRVARVRPESEWMTALVPELRIVDDELWTAVAERLDAIRRSIRSEKIRETKFWKARRPRHLLTGLIFCGECQRAMSSVGKDYLACAAARSGAACSNKKGIRRSLIEQSVLDALKERLMAPELVKEFVEAFHREINTSLHRQEIAQDKKRRDVERITRQLTGLYDAIADGLRTPGLKQRLEQLEAEQIKLTADLDDDPTPQPRLHPNLGNVYREKVEALHSALSEPDTRTETASIMRELIERIDVRTTADGVHVELTGDIVKLVALPNGEGVPEPFESSVKVAASPRNQNFQ